MEEKKTIREILDRVFMAFGYALGLVLSAMLFLVAFNDSVAIFAKRILGTESDLNVIEFITWSMAGILAFLSVVAINNSVAAQSVNDIKKAKEFLRKLGFMFLLYVSSVGLFLFVVLFAVIFSEQVEYETKGFSGVMGKWDIIKFIGWYIVKILVFLSVFSVIRWVVVQVENNTEEMEEIWRKTVVGFLFFVGALGLGLFILLMMVIFIAVVEDWATNILGISGYMSKQEVIKLVGLGVAGVLAVFGAVAVNRRASAQVRNNELAERGNVQERYKAAVEHLGSRNESVRIGSFYEFFRLANDNKDLRRNIFDILRAHLRRVTTNPKYRAKVIKNDRTTEEVQCLLDVLFRSTNRHGEFIFSGLESTLREIFLVQANLYKANLQDVKLQNVDLRGANLQKANLQGVVLQNLDLQITNLRNVKSEDTDLCISDLHSLDLYKADLREADLRGANLKEAKNLEMANLSNVRTEGVKFPKGHQSSEDVNHD